MVHAAAGTQRFPPPSPSPASATCRPWPTQPRSPARVHLPPPAAVSRGRAVEDRANSTRFPRMSSAPATLGTVQGIAALLYATCQAGLVGYSAHRWQMLGRDRQPPAAPEPWRDRKS